MKNVTLCAQLFTHLIVKIARASKSSGWSAILNTIITATRVIMMPASTETRQRILTSKKIGILEVRTLVASLSVPSSTISI